MPSAIRVNLLLKDAVEINATDLQAEWVVMVQKELCAVACMKQTFIVERLPKPQTPNPEQEKHCDNCCVKSQTIKSLLPPQLLMTLQVSIKLTFLCQTMGGNQSHKYEVSTSSFIE